MLSVINLKDSRIAKTNITPLSFSVESSSAYVLRGPNGCGKTSLLKMIVGIVEPESVGDFSLCNSYRYLPHTNALYENLKVKDYCESFPQFQEKSLMEKHICELSSGQKRRLSLFLFQQSQNKFWIMDEPTTHLDEESIKKLYDDIKTHCDLGGAVLMSSHNYVPDFMEIIDLSLSC